MNTFVIVAPFHRDDSNSWSRPLAMFTFLSTGVGILSKA